MPCLGADSIAFAQDGFFIFLYNPKLRRPGMENEKFERLMETVKHARTQNEVENLLEKAAGDEGVQIDLSMESFTKVAKKLDESGNHDLVKVLEAANGRWCELSA